MYIQPRYMRNALEFFNGQGLQNFAIKGKEQSLP